MKKKIVAMLLIAVMLAGCLTAFVGCDNNPDFTWRTNILNEFKNAKFAPDLVDVFPATVTPQATSMRTTALATVSHFATVNYNDTLDDTIELFNRFRQSLDSNLANILQEFETFQTQITEQNTWVEIQLSAGRNPSQTSGEQRFMKIEENAMGKSFYIQSKSGNNFNLQRISMLADGTNEIFTHSRNEHMTIHSYSYLKGNHYIFSDVTASATNTSSRFIEFNFADTNKNGTIVWLNPLTNETYAHIFTGNNTGATVDIFNTGTFQITSEGIAPITVNFENTSGASNALASFIETKQGTEFNAPVN